MIRRVRLVTGLVLFAYVTTHLFNHALGLVSVAAMDAGRDWFLLLWRNPVGTAALYGSMLAHLALALWALYQRRSLRMPVIEAVQLAFGLSILPLLTIHVVGTRLGSEWFGFNDTYPPVLANLWKARTDLGVRQALLLVIVWTHGCIGLHLWLRLKSGYSRHAPWLAALALLVPVLALLGFAEGGREVLRSADQPGWMTHAIAEAHSPNGTERAQLERVAENILLAFAACVAFTLLARLVRKAYESRAAAVRIRYPDGRIVVAPVGYSVLETAGWPPFPMPRCATGADGARPAGCASSADWSRNHCRPATNATSSSASVRHPMSGSPASCGRRTISRSSRSCLPSRPRVREVPSPRTAPEKSKRSACCLQTCGDSPASASARCLTTWSSTLIATSRP